MLGAGRFGPAGRRVVVEEFLSGEEASFIVMCDGRHVQPLASSQDHKARDDGDSGPNTGGMGAYSPAPVVSPDVHRRVMNEIIEPTVRGLAEEGTPYTGFLYAGLMICDTGQPKVLEFNCRFGDPETQPIMMRLRSDLNGMCMDALNGVLDDCAIEWDARAALGVVLAAQGYPGRVRSGDAITGLDAPLPEGVKVFHGGTAAKGDQVVTAGGRVLCVTALGETVGDARKSAYAAVNQISWPGMFCRRDIGARAVSRESG
jgi:phosphoribosylamine--glycine ligase